MAPSLNKIWAGIHWSVRKKMADTGHKATWEAAKDIKPFDNPVSLVFQPLVKGRMFDTTNYILSVKVIEDALVEHEILPGDTNKHVKAITMLPAVKAPEKAVEVTIKEVLLND